MQKIDIKHIDTRKFNVFLTQSNCPDNERDFQDNIGIMVCSHKHYELGDEQFNAFEYENLDDLKKHLIDDKGATVILPISLYDHSGLSISVGEVSGWDCGQVGFIYTTKQLTDDLIGNKVTNEQIEDYLIDEVKRYNDYIDGRIYDMTIKTDTGLDIVSYDSVYDSDIQNTINDTLPDAINENITIHYK